MGSFCARGATTRDAVRAGGANAAVVLHTANTASTARAICVLGLPDLDSPVPRQEQARFLRSRRNSSRWLHGLNCVRNDCLSASQKRLKAWMLAGLVCYNTLA